MRRQLWNVGPAHGPQRTVPVSPDDGPEDHEEYAEELWVACSEPAVGVRS